MLHDRIKPFKSIAWAVACLVALVIFHACANIGHPDGGAYDELPPKFVKSTPVPGALNNARKRISIEFDEYIKLENASEKVIVSPPQTVMPEIKASGKRILVNLDDSLKSNTTYTIDFSDAIVDNNEGNPLGDYAFTFSTGEIIDTMQVAGTVLDASNLEPVKGILVGLHRNQADSAFTKQPFDRVARTDSRGRFRIRGIAPGSYRAYALMDANQNFCFDQKSEMVAFLDSLVIPRMESRMRIDTIWQDTLTIDTLITRQYTHFLPDKLMLKAFKEDVVSQYMVKNERLIPEKFTFYFSAPNDTLPVIEGLNFDAKDAFLLEHSIKNDTLHYWIKDSLVYRQDTLMMAVRYLVTDTLGRLVPTIDTLGMVTRKMHTPKRKKRKDDEPEPMPMFRVNVTASSSFDVYRNIELLFDQPVAEFDTAAIHLKHKVDTLWKDVPYAFEKDSLHLRKYRLRAFWEPEREFMFSVDSAAFRSVYGLHTDKIEQRIKVKSLSDYATLYWNIIGLPDSMPVVVQLLDSQDKMVREASVYAGKADFYYLQPGKYYARLFVDANGNGVWDTGVYKEKLQPETVYYYPAMLELKAFFEVTQDWNVNVVEFDKQKPDELKKQKPDEKKKVDRNRERERQRR